MSERATELPDFARGDGLLPAIAQDAETGDVLMLGYMNRQALDETRRTGRAVYWSRSRGRLWRKGEQSGHWQHVVAILVDCDADTILLRVRQEGVACHEGYASCFFRELTPEGPRQVLPRLVDPRQVYGAKAVQATGGASMSAEAKLQQLGLELPPAPKPAGVYQPVVVVGNLAYVSGHGPLRADGTLVVGRVGDDLDQQAGYLAARQTGLAILATLKSHLGSLDRVRRVVKALGMVNATPDFTQHPAVINGFSELFGELFGKEAGIGARSAVGMGSLPGNIAVEIEVIIEIQ